MLQNAYLLAKIGADRADNEQHFAENLPKNGNYPVGLGELAKLNGPSTFGGIALLYGTPRTAEVTLFLKKFE